MFTKKYLLLCILFAFGSAAQKNQQVKKFLNQWATTMSANDASIQRLYSPEFTFPKTIFDAAHDVKYSFNTEHVMIVSTGNGNLPASKKNRYVESV